ncbi:MAG: GNAT family N-acetyltransferase [Acidobacteria bacterium]|nr:GNAT family N-acetyltransferase [Acidobacteriota bacterium]MBK8147168.1 GNAT family N-acetyltransferase [Acidobacteriota bacterium]
MVFSDIELSKRLERTEARANAAFVEARASLEPESGAAWIDIGGTYAMFDAIESPITQTFGLGMFGEVTSAVLGELETFFTDRGAPVHHEVSPLAGAELMATLYERGYRPIELTSVMYQELNGENLLDPITSPKVTTRITRAGEEELWARTSARGWSTEAEGLEEFMFGFGTISANCKGGFPFLAELDGVPISTGMLFIYDGVAILAGASTVPEGRRKGAQSALLEARLRFAVENGCTIATMGALPGSQSQRNAEKNGFRVAYTRTKWSGDFRF